MTPDDTIPTSEVRSHRPGSASSTRRIGFANASPTIASEVTPSRSIVCPEHVVLAPHHTLGHAGRAAGVEEVDVVATAAPSRCHAIGAAGGRILVRRRPVGARTVGVVDPQPRLHLRQPVADRVDRVGERTVEDDRAGVGVVPQVQQLVGGVSVVRVDRSERTLERGVRRLHVLVAVVQVLGHGLLAFEAGVEQVLCHSVGSPVDLGPRAMVVAVDQARCVG